MAKIVHSVEIARSPGPMKVGSRAKMTRLAGGRERTMTSELTEYDPARSYTFRGIDGPIRAIGKGTVEPLAEGARSRVTFELDFEGHGFGKMLVLRAQAGSEGASQESREPEGAARERRLTTSAATTMKAIDASAGRKFPLRRRRSADTVAWEYGELTLTILALAGGGTRCQALHSGTFVHLGRPSKE